MIEKKNSEKIKKKICVKSLWKPPLSNKKIFFIEFLEILFENDLV